MRIKDQSVSLLAYLLAAMTLAAIVLPFLFIVGSSFATRSEVLDRGLFFIPHAFTLNAYQYLLHDAMFTRSIGNSMLITIAGTFLNIVLTTLMAYGLTKSAVKGRAAIGFLVLFSMLFSGGMIPLYLVVKNLGLLNSYWSLYLTTAIAPFNLIVMRSFFRSLPAELEESASIDGCGPWRMLLTIVIPLSMPAIATFTLFYAVQHWNTYFSAILYINDAGRQPMQVYLRQLLVETTEADLSVATKYEFGPPVKMAAAVLASLPMIMIYPFFQKYFNQGVLLGSVKG